MKKFLSVNDIKVIMRIFKELNTKENKMDEMDIDEVNILWNNRPGTTEELSVFDYTVDEDKRAIMLTYCRDKSTNIVVFSRYMLNGKEYRTKFVNTSGMFKDGLS